MCLLCLLTLRKYDAGQVVWPHYRNVFSDVSRSSIAFSAYGILTGKRCFNFSSIHLLLHLLTNGSLFFRKMFSARKSFSSVQLRGKCSSRSHQKEENDFSLIGRSHLSYFNFLLQLIVTIINQTPESICSL